MLPNFWDSCVYKLLPVPFKNEKKIGTYNFLVFKYLNSVPLILAFSGIYRRFYFLLQTGWIPTGATMAVKSRWIIMSWRMKLTGKIRWIVTWSASNRMSPLCWYRLVKIRFGAKNSWFWLKIFPQTHSSSWAWLSQSSEFLGLLPMEWFSSSFPGIIQLPFLFTSLWSCFRLCALRMLFAIPAGRFTSFHLIVIKYQAVSSPLVNSFLISN